MSLSTIVASVPGRDFEILVMALYVWAPSGTIALVLSAICAWKRWWSATLITAIISETFFGFVLWYLIPPVLGQVSDYLTGHGAPPLDILGSPVVGLLGMLMLAAAFLFYLGLVGQRRTRVGDPTVGRMRSPPLRERTRKGNKDRRKI